MVKTKLHTGTQKKQQNKKNGLKEMVQRCSWCLFRTSSIPDLKFNFLANNLQSSQKRMGRKKMEKKEISRTEYMLFRNRAKVKECLFLILISSPSTI